MSEYYTPQRVKGLYDPALTEPFKLSRSCTKVTLATTAGQQLHI